MWSEVRIGVGRVGVGRGNDATHTAILFIHALNVNEIMTQCLHNFGAGKFQGIISLTRPYGASISTYI